MPSSLVFKKQVSDSTVLGLQSPELPLTQEDRTDIRLFEEGEYKKLLESKPLYHSLKKWKNSFKG